MTDYEAATRTFTTNVKVRATAYLDAMKRGDVYDDIAYGLVQEGDAYRAKGELLDYASAYKRAHDRACAIIVGRLFEGMESD